MNFVALCQVSASFIISSNIWNEKKFYVFGEFIWNKKYRLSQCHYSFQSHAPLFEEWLIKLLGDWKEMYLRVSKEVYVSHYHILSLLNVKTSDEWIFFWTWTWCSICVSNWRNICFSGEKHENAESQFRSNWQFYLDEG